MQIGEILRYGRPYSPEVEIVDGVRNYFFETFTLGAPLPLLERGINPIAKIVDKDGVERRPAILISSSPHKKGSLETPWQDFFDPDNGYVRYCGDNKSPQKRPDEPTGNRVLIEEYARHNSLSSEERKNSAPILFFERTRHEGRAKGFVRFHGFGIVRNAELKVQYDHKNQRPFSNYVFTFSVFSMATENEVFDWSWISARRDKNLSLDETDSMAPYSWKLWRKNGEKAFPSCERRVSRLMTVPRGEQKPRPGTDEIKALEEIYGYYTGRNHRFEALAAHVAARILGRTEGRYVDGWITPASADGGADFIGRLDLGEGLSSVKIIVLGQAKCQTLDSPTSGRDIARTVARLKRGWVGVYVTTSYFSEAVQQEVIEDAYPIMMINGMALAKEVQLIVHEKGYSCIKDLLEEIENEYESRIEKKRPEEILFL